MLVTTKKDSHLEMFKQVSTRPKLNDAYSELFPLTFISGLNMNKKESRFELDECTGKHRDCIQPVPNKQQRSRN